MVVLLTDDGALAHQLTHPSFQKEKVYLVRLNKQLGTPAKQRLSRSVELSDGPSNLTVESAPTQNTYKVTMHQGRNRQIRRTFITLGYEVLSLQRIQFGEYKLGNQGLGEYQES